MPKAGQGGQLLALMRRVAGAMTGVDMSGMTIYRTHTGHHGSLVVDQEWESIEQYEISRNLIRTTDTITRVFDLIYPLLQTTHHTEILEKV